MDKEQWLAGWNAYYAGEPCDVLKPEEWFEGWCDAAEDDSIERSENARFH